MLKKTKHTLYKRLCAVKKTKWKHTDGIKLLLGVTDFFTETKWRHLLEKEILPSEFNWDIHYYSRKIDFYRHFPSSDICFLYGLGPFLYQYLTKPYFLYFPMLGTEFLNDITLQEEIVIEHPTASVAESVAKSVAEYCLSTSIALTRNLHIAHSNQEKRIWNQNVLLQGIYRPVSSMRIGIFGVGKIGLQIAKCFNGIGAEVIGCDQVIHQEIGAISRWFHAKYLNEFLKEVDLLIVSVPLTNQTKHIINYDALTYLGKNAYIINISRGDVINERDLTKALKDEVIKGAVLDVFSKEPLSKSSTLYKFENVVITPHIAGNINLFVDEIQKDFVEKAAKYSHHV